MQGYVWSWKKLPEEPYLRHYIILTISDGLHLLTLHLARDKWHVIKVVLHISERNEAKGKVAHPVDLLALPEFLPLN